MNRVVVTLRVVGAGIWAALLPPPERTAFSRTQELDVPRWSALVGLVQGGIGLVMFVVGGLAFMRGVSSDLSRVLIENWQPGLDSTQVRATGLVGWLGWFVWPASWPWSYLAVVGLVRLVAFAVTREAVGEPVLFPLFRAVRRAGARRRQRGRERVLGPARPDRVEREDDGTLLLASAREKEGWEPGTTIEIDGRYYRIESVGERDDGPWRRVVYRLRETTAVSVIRRLVRYDPAGGGRRPSFPINH